MISTPKSSIQITNQSTIFYQHQSTSNLLQQRIPTISSPTPVPEAVSKHHTHSINTNQYCSAVIQHQYQLYGQLYVDLIIHKHTNILLKVVICFLATVMSERCDKSMWCRLALGVQVL
ncbi:hypothetical protein MKW94_018636 [Papaver nudicaule]|uniref:Uncharacterized protein n=1 Tax=Papaver nudicaule TaxID=74823 RepID=A0AA41UYG6_PAPNU|nr:hypothetical protein [Papaver nudicaule]